MNVAGAWSAMVAAIRNLGRPGIASMAISAVDTALWDLKARLLELPLVTLLGAEHDAVAVYGSGGFTSYTIKQLQEQLAGWVASGIARVKMKIGRGRSADSHRVRAARQAIGNEAQLFVDANGAYSRKKALGSAREFAELGVTWFEEPVSSDDLEGLRLIRDLGPAGMEIAVGEYGYDLFYFRRMLEAGAVDVLQAVGRRVLLPAVRDADPTTLIVADGFSCREQIAGLTGRGALHLAQFLQMALHEGPDGPRDVPPEHRYEPLGKWTPGSSNGVNGHAEIGRPGQVQSTNPVDRERA